MTPIWHSRRIISWFVARSQKQKETKYFMWYPSQNCKAVTCHGILLYKSTIGNSVPLLLIYQKISGTLYWGRFKGSAQPTDMKGHHLWITWPQNIKSKLLLLLTQWRVRLWLHKGYGWFRCYTLIWAQDEGESYRTDYDLHTIAYRVLKTKESSHFQSTNCIPETTEDTQATILS